jgi:HAE1 family hydrophobic/amphiphilic exporter-1
MWLTKTAISRPIFITMFVLALIVVGLQSRDKLPKEQMPRVDFPFVTVMVTYPGAGPNEIETQVTEPIEKAVSSIGGIKSVTSSSQDGVSSVGIEFELGTDLNAATADVRDKVSATKRMLPKDVEEPSILKVNFSARPILSLGLTGPLTPKDMRILADDYIRDRLSKVSGVASVNVGGGTNRG